MNRVIWILAVLVFGIQLAYAETPPPPPSGGDIIVTDSVSPYDDNYLPFGELTQFANANKTIRITNPNSVDLNILLATSVPYSIVAENCTTAVPVNGSWCEVKVGLSTASTGDYSKAFNITYDDTASAGTITNTVYLSGRVLSDQTVNQRPSAPTLYAPADGTTVTGSPIRFQWNKAIDPEGGVLKYYLYVCSNQNFAGCGAVGGTYVAIASLEKRGAGRHHGGVMLLFVVGLAAFVPMAKKNKVYLLLAVAVVIVAALALMACGGGGGGVTVVADFSYNYNNALTPGVTYYWKVVAEDNYGNRTDSEVWSFVKQ